LGAVYLYGVRLDYRRPGDIIMPEDDNNKLEVLSKLCERMLEVLKVRQG